MYTTSTAFLDALQEAGVSYMFANLGSDHPALVEAIAMARAKGRPIPELVTCPNEMVALSAAQGYAQVTGRPQAVIVHVECGTQALAGAVHNVAKARTPVLIFAGTSPFTQEGEMRGSRNEFIHWIQDSFDQRGLVRGYMKYDNEIRTGANVKQVVHRALQFACSDPKGPAYLIAAREVMEAETTPVELDLAVWRPVADAALPAEGLAALVADLAAAARPLVVTSYLGRKPQAVGELVAFCEKTGAGVLESAPSHLNFPASHPLYQGNHWNQPHQNEALASADVILVIDSDVPWVPLVNKPAAGAKIHHIDVDVLKRQMPLWYIGAGAAFQADAATALRQLNAAFEARPIDAARRAAREAHWAGLHDARKERLAKLEHSEALTGETLTACVRGLVDADAIVLNEGISHYHTIVDHLGLDRPGGLIASGGSSLGWNGGAAIGAKLAFPEKTVVALTGDGSYMFSVPSTVHWMARHYKTPFLQVIYNNRGWKSPKLSTLAVHPDGYASRANDIGVSFDPPPDYAGIAAAAGGALARKVTTIAEAKAALEEAMVAVKQEKRCAVIDAWLPHL